MPTMFTEDADVEAVVGSLTLEQKARLVTGETFWGTAALSEAGVPSVTMTDGPHGLRKQAGSSGDHLGLAESIPATCFPPAVGLGCSFDAELVQRVGAAIAEEARAEGVSLLLGPGMNIKRSPLCGRNFEYFSEDPLVSGTMAASLVTGIQSRGVGACVKHFAANNQETDRMRVSADVDERPLREIYLRGFEQAITESRPDAVMCAYNRINGIYAAEDRWLLTEVLREQWGFEGVVVSDWFAVGDRVESLKAGLDLEMPTTGGHSAAAVLKALDEGRLDMAALDDATSNMLRLVRRRHPDGLDRQAPDLEDHHRLAKEAATRSAVLLKNDGGLLPLSPEADVTVIGEFARSPRYQGAGSSHINPVRLETAWDALNGLAGGEARFAAGFPLEEPSTEAGRAEAERLRTEAVEAAAASQAAVVFLGLPDAEESEGFDREHMDLPQVQLSLLEAVVRANPKTVVVLSNGGAVTLSFRDEVPAILEGWLLGQAGGSATAELLYGVEAPSGRLTETIPLRLEDVPSWGAFPGEHGRVRYGEGIFVGYRGYDLKDAEVAYPFGHGLTYTSFEYSGLQAAVVGDRLQVRMSLRNTGESEGREVVQLYAGRQESTVSRAPQELIGFSPVEVSPGDHREVSLDVPLRRLAHWDIRQGRWVIEPGQWQLSAGASSRDLRLTIAVDVGGDRAEPPLSLRSTLGDALAHPELGEEIRGMVQEALSGEEGAFTAEGLLRLLESFPLDRLPLFPEAGLDQEKVDSLIRRAAL